MLDLLDLKAKSLKLKLKIILTKNFFEQNTINVIIISILITAPNINNGIRPKSLIKGPKTRLQTASAIPNDVITKPI